MCRWACITSWPAAFLLFIPRLIPEQPVPFIIASAIFFAALKTFSISLLGIFIKSIECLFQTNNKTLLLIKKEQCFFWCLILGIYQHQFFPRSLTVYLYLHHQHKLNQNLEFSFWFLNKKYC